MCKKIYLTLPLPSGWTARAPYGRVATVSPSRGGASAAAAAMASFTEASTTARNTPMVVALVASSAAGGSQPSWAASNAAPTPWRQSSAKHSRHSTYGSSALKYDAHMSSAVRLTTSSAVCPAAVSFSDRTVVHCPSSHKVVKSPGNRAYRYRSPSTPNAWPGTAHPSSPAIFGRGCPSQVCQLEGFSSPTFESVIHLLSQRQHSIFQRE